MLRQLRRRECREREAKENIPINRKEILKKNGSQSFLWILCCVGILWIFSYFHHPVKVWTFQELTQTDSLYIVIAGEVYDVSTGSKHYGPNGPYHYFTGRDGTRAYITGKPEDARAQVLDLTTKQLLPISKWLQFFSKHETYRYLGVVQDIYYDQYGKATKARKELDYRLSIAMADEALEKDEKTKYPSCNSAWKAGEGGKVWCKAEDRYPRKTIAGRCACFTSIDLAQDTTLEQFHNCQRYDKICYT